MKVKDLKQILNKIHNEGVSTTCGTSRWPQTEEEAIAKWGPKPSPKHKFGIHGWYDPAEGIPRC